MTHLPSLKRRKFPGWLKVKQPVKVKGSRQLLPATPCAFNSTRKEEGVAFTFPWTPCLAGPWESSVGCSRSEVLGPGPDSEIPSPGHPLSPS